MFSSQVMDSHKDIYYEQNEDYVEANIDAKYLNHALFNLLDNAIKYGYEGSVIRINMNVDREESLLFVEFVSYGIEVEEGDRIYQLFERSEQAAKIASGTGIGMYIVKKICEAHGGEVTHQSEKLSDYNIPVLFNSKNTKSIMNNLNLGQIIKIENEISRLVGPIEHEVVCDYSFVKYARVFSTRINQPTYRNTFCITIPLD